MNRKEIEWLRDAIQPLLMNDPSCETSSRCLMDWTLASVENFMEARTPGLAIQTFMVASKELCSCSRQKLLAAMLRKHNVTDSKNGPEQEQSPESSDAQETHFGSLAWYQEMWEEAERRQPKAGWIRVCWREGVLPASMRNTLLKR